MADQCRMYENELPKVDDVVMVQVVQIADMGAYVKLLEYGNREGMILLSELSRRRIRSVQKIIRVNKQEIVTVLRVDEEKGYIDLSKRRVTQEDAAKCEERYKKSKKVHAILRNVAKKVDVTLLSLYESIGWPLNRKFGHVYDAFQMAIIDADKVFEGLTIEPDVKEALMKQIDSQLTPEPVKVRAQLELKCAGPDGVNAVIAALEAGETVSTKEIPVKVTYLAAPYYVVTVDATDKSEAFEVMDTALNEIKKKFETFRLARYKLDKEPVLVSVSDDNDFQALLDRTQKQNEDDSDDDAEFSGSEDDDDDI